MVLVVSVEDDPAVALEPGGDGLPVGLESLGVGDDVAVVSPKVLGVDDGVCAFACDVVDDIIQALGYASSILPVKALGIIRSIKIGTRKMLKPFAVKASIVE